MWLNSGTITVQSGSRYVDGQGTQFVGPVLAGYGLLTGDLRLYEIEAVESATRLRLVRPYQGGGAANIPYDIVPIGADVAALIERIQALIDRYQAFRDTVGQGLFPAGSAAAPGVRFIADQDTGIYNSSPNVLGIAAGGVAAATFLPTRADFSGHIKLEDRKAIALLPDSQTWSFAGGPAALYGLTVGVNIGAGGPATVIAGFGGLIFGTGAIEQARFDQFGNLLVGTPSGPCHTIARGNSDGIQVLNVSGLTAGSAAFFSGGGAASSNAACAIKVATSAVTGRSINAGGTGNFSGSDYAEYMTKRADCGLIAKGDVCGVDRDGLLTRTWADAISFVVKSTDPSLVGGDTWAAHLPPRPDAPGPEPQPPAIPVVPAEGADDAEVAVYQDSLAAYPALAAQYRVDHDAWAAATAAYARDLPAWEAELEAARQCVDRIAFCGQVPCNVSGDFEVGDYILAAQDGDGIKAVAVKVGDITLAQYMGRIGKVWAIRDGRAWIDVQHG